MVGSLQSVEQVNSQGLFSSFVGLIGQFFDEISCPWQNLIGLDAARIYSMKWQSGQPLHRRQRQFDVDGPLVWPKQ
uniref:hypothetical protein n=1 Tax=Rhodococcus sp. G-MC3 TaxID=3046209 RepID=UPI0024B892E8|nr:hypothetical protein [Rhodococcus sp. G-MC3]MDJ0392429.1 hypothetical protein [Rhodococcus sp. G-MC3]